VRVQTAAQVVRVAQEVEEKSYRFYERLSTEYPEKKEVFLSLAKENRRNKLWIQRSYNEAVSDVFETGFCSGGLTVDAKLIRNTVAEVHSWQVAVEKALKMEEEIQTFYQNTANRLQSFLAGVSRTLGIIARRREKRLERIRALLS